MVGDTVVHLLARDAAIRVATAYRYLHEAVDVIAERAPELTDVLAEDLESGWAYVCLDAGLDRDQPLHCPLENWS